MTFRFGGGKITPWRVNVLKSVVDARPVPIPKCETVVYVIQYVPSSSVIRGSSTPNDS